MCLNEHNKRVISILEQLLTLVSSETACIWMVEYSHVLGDKPINLVDDHFALLQQEVDRIKEVWHANQ